MKDFNISSVLSILSRALDCIDERLIDHGNRVAYMVYKMMQADGSYSDEDMREICITTALHDIGAFKTEEIDNMAVFESMDVWEHSIYGYLFIKNMTPLRKWAELVLYHHLDFEKYPSIESEILKLADMIHLSDRMDIVLYSREILINADFFSIYQSNKFSKDVISLFLEANRKYEIEKHIRDGSYMKELQSFVSEMDYDENTLLDYIKMIAYSIDFRSETTVSHVITTVSISVALGIIFGLDEEELKKIRLGAYIHDIGKIATPLEILEKPGSLTNDELIIMRNHIVDTKKILEGRISSEILEIAYRHHEKMDGSGYPECLMGEELTLSERIVAVADIMSALTGKRSYKDSFDKETVIDILRRQGEKGKLCGDVVQAAIVFYDSIMKRANDNSKKTFEMYRNIRQEFDDKLNRVGAWV
ncbi:HD-GYP domain-containing protein [Sinanaerobacter chloroacetimidivorans]|jgi:HD-GYP domain-containing protein (c-di-GMP phosphodiesterase class II)|uniref:HD domain-containing protein n=1 Tax=Sinanaerobacter chloroacetimidivorans TaxID=2818044 RepID=A0A8J8AZW9_9FIRM|nr:HD domain-containing phosphohydrolase [Sinanaerobacter chloroacetimidivorans]MBR0596978.1 HD domain-containing protein [Sinanaerobacter chloroacetimidivorans]